LAIYIWALGHVFTIYEHLIAPLFKKITPVSIFALLIILKLMYTCTLFVYSIIPLTLI